MAALPSNKENVPFNAEVLEVLDLCHSARRSARARRRTYRRRGGRCIPRPSILMGIARRQSARSPKFQRPRNSKEPRPPPGAGRGLRGGRPAAPSPGGARRGRLAAAGGAQARARRIAPHRSPLCCSSCIIDHAEDPPECQRAPPSLLRTCPRRCPRPEKPTPVQALCKSDY